MVWPGAGGSGTWTATVGPYTGYGPSMNITVKATVSDAAGNQATATANLNLGSCTYIG
jgi:hypothetical protein